MEATLSALSIGALIFGIMKSRQFQDSNDITTVIPPSFGQALTTYQQNPNNDNLKKLEELKLKEQNELDKVKQQVQEEANRKIAQVLSNAKAQAQKMYAQGKLEEAKNIERMAELKRTTLQEDTQSNLQELAKRFQNTMSTVNTMITDAKLITDKDLKNQINMVSNELRTSRNNEALLRQQVAQLEAQLKKQPSNATSQKQIQELKSALDSAKACAYETDMLKRELSILKSARNGDQNAARISNQFLELKRQLDEAKQNEQRLLFQIEKERMMKNSGTNVASKFKIQELENEINRLRKVPSGNVAKDSVISNLQFELDSAKRREKEAIEQLVKMRDTKENVRQLQNETQFAKQRAYELERELQRLTGNSNQKVTQMADEIARLKYLLQNAKEGYTILRDNKNASVNNEELFYAKQQVKELQQRLQALNIAGNSRSDDFKYAFRIAELENELQRERLNKTPRNASVTSLEKELNQLRAQSSAQAQELSNVISKYTHELEQARAKETQARKELSNAKINGENNEELKMELSEAQRKIRELQAALQRSQTNTTTNTGLSEQLAEAKRYAQTIQDNVSRHKNSIEQYKEQLNEARNTIQTLRKEIETLQSFANMSEEDKQKSKVIADLQMQVQTQQTALQNALSNAKKARAEVATLEQQQQLLDEYEEKIASLEMQLRDLRNTPRINPNSNKLEDQANAIIQSAREQGQQIIQEAEERAHLIRSKANDKIVNAPLTSNADVISKLMIDKENAAKRILDDANRKQKALEQQISSLMDKLNDVTNKNTTLQNQINSLKSFEGANSARFSLTMEIMKSVEEVRKMSNSNVDDECLKKLNDILQKMKRNFTDVEQSIIQSKASEGNVAEQISQLQQVLQQKDVVLAKAEEIRQNAAKEIQNVVTKANVVAQENPSKIPEMTTTVKQEITQIQKKADENIGELIEKTQQSIGNSMGNSKGNSNSPSCTSCIKVFHPYSLTSICTQMPEHIADMTDTLYKQVHKELDDNSKIYVEIDNNLSPYSSTNRINDENGFLMKFFNTFVPIIKNDYKPDSKSGSLTETLDISKSGIWNTLVELKNFVNTGNITYDKLYIKESVNGQGYRDSFNIQIIKQYISLMKIILLSPVTYAFTSLYTTVIQQLQDPTFDIQLQLFDESNNVINRNLFIMLMYKFLYIDVTLLIQLKTNSKISTFYNDNFLKYESVYIPNDSNNCNIILKGTEKCETKFLYIDRFLQAIQNSLIVEEQSTSASASVFYELCVFHLARSLPFLVSFVTNIYKNVESKSNQVSLADKINNILRERLIRNVLTYVKVRNDDRIPMYNHRFRMYTNTGDDKSARTTLLVKYNEHPIPYYSRKKEEGGRIVVHENLENNYGALYKKPRFDASFEVIAENLIVKRYKEEYLFGPFTRIFPQEMTNGMIAEQMTEVITHLSSNEPRPVFLIGYGASGAGKTSTLIYFNKADDFNKNGVLMHLCMSLKESYPKIRVKCYEFYNKLENLSKNNYVVKTRESEVLYFEYVDGDISDFVLSNEYSHKNAFKDRVGAPTTRFNKGTSLGKVIIHMIDNDRFVKATTNNPNSSRSHTLIFINFGTSYNVFNDKRTLIIGDFAGVENAFDCDDENQLLGFLRVREDTAPGDMFYSKKDKSLYGLEGGKVLTKHRNKNKKTIKKVGSKRPKVMKGGYFDESCDYVMHDRTQEFFKLYRNTVKTDISEGDIKLLRHQINPILPTGVKIEEIEDIQFNYVKSMFTNAEDYGVFISSVFVNIIEFLNPNLNVSDSLNTLLKLSKKEILDVFKNYMTNFQDGNATRGMGMFINNTNAFFNIFSKVHNNNNDVKNGMTFIRDEVFKNTILQDKVTKDKIILYDFLTLGQGIELDVTNPKFTKNRLEALGKLNNYKDKIYHTITSGEKFKSNTPFYKHIGSLNGKEITAYNTAQNIVLFESYSLEKSANFKIGTYDLSEIKDLTRIIVKAPHPHGPDYKGTKDATTYEQTFSVQEIYTEMGKFFDDPFFKYIGIWLEQSSYFRFKDIFYKFTDKTNYERIKVLDSIKQYASIDTLCFAIVKEALELLLDVKCRKSYYQHICTVRRKEGEFINTSLSEMRTIIKDIMFEKNKNCINISPLFHKPCLPAYCADNECFKMKVNQKSFSNKVFETIVKEIEPKLEQGVLNKKFPVALALQDLVIGVFVVVNISRMANNPPPVPYIDTNSIRVAFNEKGGIITEKVVEECVTLLTRIKTFTSNKATAPLVIDENHIRTLEDIISNKKAYIDNPRQYKQISDNLLSALQYFENISAASLIGTLHYTDALSKYNTTDAVCTEHTFRKNKNSKDMIPKYGKPVAPVANDVPTDYNMLLPQLGLKDVVNGQLYCADNKCFYQETRLIEELNEK
jgi:vacuolar-type H+-ATPase subunit H